MSLDKSQFQKMDNSFKKFNEFLKENLFASKISKWHLENSVDGECGIFAATYKKLNPKSEVFGILDISYKPKPTIQHYFIKDKNLYFDGSGVKTIKDFENLYNGIAIKVNNEGYEEGKTEDEYSDLPDFGFDTRYEKIMKK
jgi:hypothetical protein